MLEHGAIDMIVDRRELQTKVANILAKLTDQTIALAPGIGFMTNMS